jgi:NAD kinase
MVLPHPQEIRVDLPNNTTETYLTVGGQEGYRLHKDNVVLVRGVPGGALFARRDKDAYLRRLKERGFLAERAGNVERPLAGSS